MCVDIRYTDCRFSHWRGWAHLISSLSTRWVLRNLWNEKYLINHVRHVTKHKLERIPSLKRALFSFVSLFFLRKWLLQCRFIFHIHLRKMLIHCYLNYYNLCNLTSDLSFSRDKRATSHFFFLLFENTTAYCKMSLHLLTGPQPYMAVQRLTNRWYSSGWGIDHFKFVLLRELNALWLFTNQKISYFEIPTENSWTKIFRHLLRKLSVLASLAGVASKILRLLFSICWWHHVRFAVRMTLTRSTAAFNFVCTDHVG